MNPIIVTDNLVLRRPRASDWPAVRTYLLSQRYRGFGFADDEKTAWLFYAALLGHWDLCDFGLFVALSRDSQDPVGMFGPWFPCTWPEPEMTWHLLNSDLEGRGLAYEAATAVLHHLFTAKKFHSIASFINPDEHRSITLAKRLGATLDEGAPIPNNPNRPNLTTYRHKRRA